MFLPVRIFQPILLSMLLGAACSSSDKTGDSSSSGGATPGVGGHTAPGGTNGLGGSLSVAGASTAQGGTTPAQGGTIENGGSGQGGASTARGGSGEGGSGRGGDTTSPQGGATITPQGGTGQGGSTITAQGGSAEGGATVAEGGTGQGGGTTTPTFASDDDEILYLAVRFYGAERCGDTHNWTLANNPAGSTCHLRDGETEGLDLSGGWHDAGDHVKVTLTIAYAAYIMLKAYEVYPSAFLDRDDQNYQGSPNGVPDVLDEARIGLDWLVKAHPDAERLVAMVGSTTYDHSTFMTSPTQSTNTVEGGGDPRPLQMGAMADFAGMTAAALALGSRVYQSIDATLAATYLEHARSAFAFGERNPGLSTSQLYAWAGMPYVDDLLCGATELWRTTGEEAFHSAAVGYDGEIGDHESVANYAQVSDFCRHSLVKGGEEGSLSAWKAVVDRYLTMLSTDSNLSGLIYVDQWGTCRHAMAAAFSAALLFDATGETAYRDFARSQYAWVKGENPQSRSFIIGWGENPPTRPHHRNAYGYEDDVGWDADTPQLSDERPFKVLLRGALAGGPNLEGYQDSVNDYIHNEVAIDYNAGLVATAAFAVANP